MKVVGIYVVRNEVDIIETNRRHHLAVIIDEAIVMHNGSTDGTLQRLADLSRDLPILRRRARGVRPVRPVHPAGPVRQLASPAVDA